MNGFQELVTMRESCRKYKECAVVTHEQLMRCVEAARLAPSACNSQPWHFTIVEDPALRARVADAVSGPGLNRFAKECSAFIVVGERRPNLFSRAGALAIGNDFSQIDVGIATAHLCLAAADQGLGTCIMGWRNEAKLKEFIPTAPDERIRLVVAVGIPENPVPREKKRKPLDEILDCL